MAYHWGGKEYSPKSACENWKVHYHTISGVIYELRGLADLYSAEGNFESAENTYVEVARAMQHKLGAEHPQTVYVYLQVIEARIAQGNHYEAEKMHAKIHSKILSLFDHTHQVTVKSMSVMADIQYWLENDPDAEALSRQILQITLNKFGVQHDLTVKAMATLAEMLASRVESGLGHLLEPCEWLLRRAIDIDCKLSGDSETALFYNLRELARVLELCDQLEESVRLMREVLRRSWRKYGIQHPTIVKGLLYLGRRLRKRGSLEESEALITLSISLNIGFYGLHNVDVIKGIGELATILKCMRRWEEAASRFEELYRDDAEQYSAEHKYRKESERELRQCYLMQGLYKEELEFEERLSWIRRIGSRTTVHNEKRARKWSYFESEVDWCDEEIPLPKRVCDTTLKK